MNSYIEDDLAFGMEEIDIAENDSGEGDADVETVDNSVLTFSKHTGNFFFIIQILQEKAWCEYKYVTYLLYINLYSLPKFFKKPSIFIDILKQPLADQSYLLFPSICVLSVH